MRRFNMLPGLQGFRNPLARLAAHLMLLIFLLGLWIYLIAQSPSVPYNVRELLFLGRSLLGGAALAAMCFFALLPPALLGVQLLTAPLSRAWLFPLGILAHAGLTYAGLRFSVPLESIHDVIGSPVWNGSPDAERLYRFTGLFSAISVLVAGAAAGLLARVDTFRASRFGRWLVFGVALLPVSHWIVVESAATDNLVELMAGGGSIHASLFLALWVLLVAFGASVLSARLAAFFRDTMSAVLALVLILPLASGAVLLGTEQEIIKYGQEFSALQFLLSPDRQGYVGGGSLVFRYVIAHFSIQALLAVTQLPVWLWLAQGEEARAR